MGADAGRHGEGGQQAAASHGGASFIAAGDHAALLEGSLELLPTVQAAVDQAAPPGSAGAASRLDLQLPVGEEQAQQVGGDAGRFRQFGILRQVREAGQPGPITQVVGAARELHEAAPLEQRAVGRPVVAEIAPVVVEIEGMAVRRGVEGADAFADRRAAAVSARMVAMAISTMVRSGISKARSDARMIGRWVLMFATAPRAASGMRAARSCRRWRRAGPRIRPGPAP